MKQIILIQKASVLVTLILLSTAATSQELFPGLSVLSSPQKSSQQKNQPANVVKQPQQVVQAQELKEEQVSLESQTDNSVSGLSTLYEETSTSVAESPAPENTTSNKQEQGENENEDDTDTNRKIRMYLDGVDNTLAPVRTMSFCFANIKLYNQLKKTVSSFQATLTYGQIPIKFSASNVAPNGTATQELTLAGTACESMLDTPKINIVKCTVPGMDEAQCKKRFIFEPYEESF